MTGTKKPATGKQSAFKNTTSKVYTNLACIPIPLILAGFKG
jgi:hypothetical protein